MFLSDELQIFFRDFVESSSSEAAHAAIASDVNEERGDRSRQTAHLVAPDRRPWREPAAYVRTGAHFLSTYML